MFTKKRSVFKEYRKIPAICSVNKTQWRWRLLPKTHISCSLICSPFPSQRPGYKLVFNSFSQQPDLMINHINWWQEEEQSRHRKLNIEQVPSLPWMWAENQSRETLLMTWLVPHILYWLLLRLHSRFLSPSGGEAVLHPQEGTDPVRWCCSRWADSHCDFDLAKTHKVPLTHFQ